MNVSLTPELEQLIHKKVESGMYLSASEVVREALRWLEERDRLRELRLEELRREIRVGIDQADRGDDLAEDYRFHRRRGPAHRQHAEGPIHQFGLDWTRSTWPSASVPTGEAHRIRYP